MTKSSTSTSTTPQGTSQAQEYEEDFELIRDDVKRFGKCTYMDVHGLGEVAIKERLGNEYAVEFDSCYVYDIYIITRSENGREKST